MEIISRTYYASKLDSWIGKGNIIVLVGSRRTGKSYVLKDFIQRHKDEEDTNIIYIDKEKKDYKDIKTDAELNEFIEARWEKGRHNYILIDEVQDIEGMRRAFATGIQKKKPISS